MGDLHEMVDLGAVGRLFMLLAIIGPLLGSIIGYLYGRSKGVDINGAKAGTIAGALWGSLGTINWLLWRVYNICTDRNGLDTVKNLFLNLGLFLIAGVAIGAIAGRLYSRFWASESKSKASTATQTETDIANQ